MQDVTGSVELEDLLAPDDIAIYALFATLEEPDHDGERRLRIRGEVSAPGKLDEDLEVLLLVNDGEHRLVATTSAWFPSRSSNFFDVLDLRTRVPAGVSVHRIRLVARSV